VQAGVSAAIAVRVLLIAIGNIGAIVLQIGDPIGVAIGTAGIGIRNHGRDQCAHDRTRSPTHDGSGRTPDGATDTRTRQRTQQESFLCTRRRATREQRGENQCGAQPDTRLTQDAARGQYDPASSNAAHRSRAPR